MKVKNGYFYISPKRFIKKKGLPRTIMWWYLTMKEATPKERYEVRLEKGKPILDIFLAWLKTKQPQVASKSKVGEAITYCLNQWEYLEAFLKYRRLEIDNNRSKRAIKPLVIGRKNGYFQIHHEAHEEARSCIA